MNARDELAKVIDCADVTWQDEKTVSSAEEWSQDIANAVLYAGYRKPRTITTVEEVDALPNRSAVLTPFGDAVTIYRDIDVTADHFHFIVTYGPATVIHEPEAA